MTNNKAISVAGIPKKPSINLEENENWKKIKHFVYNHPVYGELNEVEKDQAVANIFDKHQNDDMSLLSEYVDMYMLPTGSFGQNTGTGIAYSQPGLGSTGGGGSPPGYGGLGTGMLGGKSRQGTRVFGYGASNGISPGDGYAPIAGKNGEPALVVIPQKQDNYKPWEVQLTPDGQYRQNDIDRNKYVRKEEQMWNGPVGDLFRSLENYGYDIEDLNQMSQEELEDAIIRSFKKEMAKVKSEQDVETLQENQQIIQSSPRLITYKELIDASNRLLGKLGYNVQELSEEEKDSISSHAINFFNEYNNKMSDLDVPEKMGNLLEKWKRYSKIQLAREILSSKHQQKKAIEKETGGKAYLIDRYGIEKLMTRFGYSYDDNSKTWLKTSKKKDVEDKKSKKSSSIPGSGSRALSASSDTSSAQKAGETTRGLSSPTGTTSDQTSSTRQSGTFDPNTGSYIATPLSTEETQKIKEYQARFILSLVHDMKDSNKFNYDEENEIWVPVIPSEKILESMDNLMYDWDNEKHIWLDQNLTIPNALYEKGENKQTLVGRSYLAALGKLDYIKSKEDGEPNVGVEQISIELRDEGFQYDEETGNWKYVGEIAEPAEVINEAVTKFNAGDVEEMIGRLLLNAIQKQKLIKEQTSQQTTVKNQQPDQKQTQNKPEEDNQIRAIGQNEAPYGKIERELKDMGFNTFRSGNIEYWARKEKEVPAEVSAFTGDNLATYIARGILASLNPKNAIKYLDFHGSTPFKTPKQINAEMEYNDVKWDESKSSWIPQDPTKPEKKIEGYEDITDENLRKMFVDDDKFETRYKNSDWNSLTSKEQEKYKDVQARKAAINVLGLDKNKWPTGNDLISQHKRKSLINKLQLSHKWDPESKSFVKRNKRAVISGNQVDFKELGKRVLGFSRDLAAFAGSSSVGLLSALYNFGAMYADRPTDQPKAINPFDAVRNVAGKIQSKFQDSKISPETKK